MKRMIGQAGSAKASAGEALGRSRLAGEDSGSMGGAGKVTHVGSNVVGAVV